MGKYLNTQNMSNQELSSLYNIDINWNKGK